MARSERFDRIEPACGERRGQRPERRIAAGEDSDPLSRSRPFLTLGERGDAPRDAVAAIDEAHPMRARRGEFGREQRRSEEHTSELQSLMRISYAVFFLKKKNTTNNNAQNLNIH